MTNYNFLTPYTFNNGLRVKNRIVMAPMTTNASFHDGHLTVDELNYYRLRTGGVGRVITAAAYISELGKGFEGQSSAAADDFLPDLEKKANTIKINGSKAILQKVERNDEAAIRYTLCPVDYEELMIPAPLQSELKEKFFDPMNFTRDNRNTDKCDEKRD